MALVSMLDFPQALGKKLVFLAGNMTADSSGDPAAIEGKGFGLTATFPHVGTISHDATGTYTLTLPGSGTVDVLASFFQVQAGAARYPTVTIRDDDSRTITVLITDDSGADTDLGDGEQLHFLLVVKNSSV